jgi:hypothetical protein
MTIQQMAIATRSSVVWLNNSRRILGRKIHRTPSGARWWGLVRLLDHEIGLPLRSAARAADAILGAGLESNRLRFSVSTDGSVALQIDLERFHSTANALLAAAFAFAPPGKRGRRPRVQAALMSAGKSAAALRIRIENEPERLEQLAAQLRAVDARPRGIEGGLPFIMDVATLRAVSRLALTTRSGDVDVQIVTGPDA